MGQYREQALRGVAEFTNSTPKQVEQAIAGEMRFMQKTAQDLCNDAVAQREAVLEKDALLTQMAEAMAEIERTAIDYVAVRISRAALAAYRSQLPQKEQASE